jgi:pantetheine-phosphate adenylyltransferase
MKNTAVYPGTFDPLTNGHLDIIKRAARMFDTVIVAVLVNPSKQPLFSVKERVAHIQDAVKDIKNVKVKYFEGLLVDFMRAQKSAIAIRGLRAVSDFEYEFQLAHTNRALYNEMETVFLMPSAKYTYLTSSMVREAYSLGGKLKDVMPAVAEEALIKKYSKK